MIALGLLLLVATGTAGVAIALSNTDSTSITALGVTLDTLTLGGVFALGAAMGALFLLGLLMILGGSRRRRARRVATRREVKQARSERDALAHENDDLRARVETPASADPTDGTDARTRA